MLETLSNFMEAERSKIAVSSFTASTREVLPAQVSNPLVQDFFPQKNVTLKKSLNNMHSQMFEILFYEVIKENARRIRNNSYAWRMNPYG